MNRRPDRLPDRGVIALAASVVVGYLTIDALIWVARRGPFWVVYVGLSALAVVGGGLLVV